MSDPTSSPADGQTGADDESVKPVASRPLATTFQHRLTEWAPVVPHLLAKLSDPVLSLVLGQADRKATEKYLEACGLLRQWKQHSSKAKASEQIVKNHRDKLVAEKVSVPFYAGAVLLTWWARRAAERLSSTPLGSEVKGLKLREAYGYCCEALVGAAPDVQAALVPRGPGEEELLFSLLGRATAARCTREEFRERAMGFRTDRKEAPLGRDGGTSSTRTTSPLEPATPEPFPAATVTISSQAAPSAADSPWPATEELAPLTDRLRSHLALRAEMQQALSAGLDALRLLPRLQGLEASERAAEEAFARFQTERGLPPAPPPKACLASQEAAVAYLQRLSESLTAARRKEATRVEDVRHRLLETLQELGIVPPPELQLAKTIVEVDSVRLSMAPLLEFEQAYRRSDGRANPSDLGLAAPQRIAYLLRALDESKQSPHSVLQLVLQDREVLGRGGATVQQVEKLIAEALHGDSPLPAGIWSRLVKDRGAAEALSLAESAVFFAGGDESRLDPAGITLLSDQPCSSDLKRVIERAELARLAPHARVERAAALAAEELEDSSRLGDLAISLAAVDRDSAALAVIVFNLHANRTLPCSEATAKDLLLSTLVDAVQAGPEARQLAKCLVEDPVWMLGPDEYPLLAYFAKALDEADFIQVVRDAYPEERAAARERRPALLESLEAPVRQAVPTSKVGQVELALNQLRHDMTRRSCYASWPPAIEYQAYFNEVLEGALSGDANLVPSASSPDVIISEAHDRRRLPDVEGKAVRAMRQYLTEQLARVQAIRDGLPGHWTHSSPEAELASRKRDLRSELLAERRTGATTKALMKLYAIVESVKC